MPPAPPENSGYYRPPVNSPIQPNRPPGVYFDTISTSFTIIQKDVATWVLSTLVYILAMVPLTVIAFLVQNRGQFFATTFDLNSWLQGEAISIANIFPSAALLGGMIHMGVKAANGEEIEVKDMFYAIPKIWTVGLAMILLWLGIVLGTLLLIVPGIFLAGAFALALPVAVEQNVGAVEALKISYNAAKPHAWSFFGLMFIGSIVSGLGYIACGLGILFTFPILPIIMGAHYTYFFPKDRIPTPASYQFLEPPRL